jgi:glucose/arabinose dehydrogenase
MGRVLARGIAAVRKREWCLLALASLLLCAAPSSAAGRASLRLAKVAQFDQPVYATAPAGEPDRLYVVEQAGVIRIVDRGQVLASPFLDIRSLVLAGGEQGLLSMAFSPDYATSRLFYVDYTARNGNTVVAEYRVGAGKAVRTRTLLDFADPAPNHNGGQLQAGPDGALWWGNGDGGGGGDTYGNGQRPTGDFAKIKRLDLTSRNARWQTWAIGLRNPWRFSFDRATKALYIGDVGQNKYEEIDYIPRGRSHLNFGWNHYEGRARYGSEPLQPGWRYTAPVLVYDHRKGCSVTGGYVYRGSKIAAATGRYFYGDYCSGTVWSFRIAGERATDNRREPFTVPGLSSFGEDASGELYLMSAGDGDLYRLTS